MNIEDNSIQGQPPASGASEGAEASSIITRIAPEDIRLGDYVIALHEVDQYTVHGCEESWKTRPEVYVVAVRTIATYTQIGRVRAIALPYIIADAESGDLLLDTRLKELGRVPAAFGRVALRRLDRRRARRRRVAAEARSDSLPDPREGAD